MKKLTTIFMTLSLFLGSSLFAQNIFSSFYPAEDNDTPDYVLSLDSNDDRVQHTTSKKTMIKDKNAFSSFYPAEDSDTPDYLRN